ncbi:MAG: DUF3179 domain-containing protein [Acidiferrobacterales bacterium]
MFQTPRSLRRRLYGTAILLATTWTSPTFVPVTHAQGYTDPQWPKTDFSKTLVDLDEIISGGPPKDGIPAIDKPEFVSTREASDWVNPQEPVIVVSVAADARAYPLQILIWHEIVNDTVGGRLVSVTFCPLCNSSLVFDRRVNDRVLDFGTTGRLRKSDLVMYDRQTESWWQQLTGRAIVGELAGTRLTQVPASIVAFGDFAKTYPNGKVLSRRTGYSRPYGNNPYRGYDRIGDQPFLFTDTVDPRLPAMERVISISVNGKHKLYPFSIFANDPIINDKVNGLPVVVFSRQGTLSVLDQETIARSRAVPSATAYERELNGRVLTFELRDGKILDRETQSQWGLFGNAIDGQLIGQRLKPTESGVHFAFAWLAFNVDSEIYGR